MASLVNVRAKWESELTSTTTLTMIRTYLAKKQASDSVVVTFFTLSLKYLKTHNEENKFWHIEFDSRMTHIGGKPEKKSIEPPNNVLVWYLQELYRNEELFMSEVKLQKKQVPVNQKVSYGQIAIFGVDHKLRQDGLVCIESVSPSG